MSTAQVDAPVDRFEAACRRTRRRARILAHGYDDLLRELAGARDEIASLRRELEETRRRIAASAARSPAAPRYPRCTRALEVARRRIGHAEAPLDAIREVVVDIVGCEELIVFRLRSTLRGEVLDPVLAFGAAAPAAPIVFDASGPIAAALEASARAFDPAAAAALGDVLPARPAAFVPLRRDGEVVGALALMSLLPHKPALVEDDLAVLDLLAHEGGAALARGDARAAVAA
jgi:GAF domain-containing protein